MTNQKEKIDYIKNKLSDYKNVFIVSIIVGLLAYMYAFTNKLPNHDDVYSLFLKGGTIGSGRWGLELCSFIFPDFSMPWIYGIISISFVSVASCIIIEMFKIKSNIFKYLLSGTIIVFPSLINIFSFMFTATSYCLAFLLSVSAVFLWIKKSWISKLTAVVALILAMGIYQAFLGVSASLFVIYSIRETLKDDSSAKDVLLKGIAYILCLGVSVAIYFLITKITQSLSGIQYNEYTETALEPGISVLHRLILIYRSFIFEFISDPKQIVPTAAGKVFHLIVIAVSGFELFFILFKKKVRTAKAFLIFALIAVLPVSIYCLILYVNYYYVRAIALWSFVSVYVLIIVIADIFINSGFEFKISPFINKALSVFFALIIALNIYIANAAYLRIDVKMRHVQSFYTTVISRAEMTEGFDENTVIALIGSKENSDLVYDYDEFDKIGVTVDSDIWVDIYSYREFIKYYIGYNGPIATDEEISNLKQTEEFNCMGIYPYADSVKKIGNYMVVRFE